MLGEVTNGHRKRYANHTRFLFRSVSPHLPVLPSADARSTFPAAAHQRTGLCCVVDAPQLPLFDPDELYAVDEGIEPAHGGAKYKKEFVPGILPANMDQLMTENERQLFSVG